MSTKEETKEAMIQGINRFLFCGWNFETTLCEVKMHGDICHVTMPRVIAEAKWSCNLEHMIAKWNDATRSGNPDAYFPRFYAELSVDNRRAFLEWIIENYKNEQKI